MRTCGNLQNYEIYSAIKSDEETFEEKESEEPSEGYRSLCYELLNELSFYQK